MVISVAMGYRQNDMLMTTPSFILEPTALAACSEVKVKRSFLKLPDMLIGSLWNAGKVCDRRQVEGEL
jgi:hypothetical protein